MNTDIIYTRKCPICNKELTTKNKYWHTNAVLENKKCGSCVLRGRKFSEEHKLNLSKNHADVIGENNPFYTKTHTKHSIDKMLLTRSKHPTWRENASNTMKCIRSQYWANSNPMNSPSSVQKIRLKRIAEIKLKNNNQISPNYNTLSIPIIEQKAKELGITDLQHAENGGEFYINELGYWVDGYSKEKNIVIEFYEKHHNRKIEKDLQRQKEITDLLKCKFIVIKEYEN